MTMGNNYTPHFFASQLAYPKSLEGLSSKSDDSQY